MRAGSQKQIVRQRALGQSNHSAAAPVDRGYGSDRHSATAVRVFDGFVQDADLRAEICMAHPSLTPDPTRGAQYARTGERYKTNIKAVGTLIKLAFTDLASFRGCGVEYWSNTLQAGESVHGHFDKDEALYLLTGETITPELVLVYYADRCRFEGGALWIEDGIDIHPRENRLVVFGGERRHGVRQVLKGTRRSLVMNAWRESPFAYR